MQRTIAIVIVPALLILAFGLLATETARKRNAPAKTGRGEVVGGTGEASTEFAADGAPRSDVHLVSKDAGESAEPAAGPAPEEKSPETLSEKFARLLAEERARKTAGVAGAKSLETSDVDQSGNRSKGRQSGDQRAAKAAEGGSPIRSDRTSRSADSRLGDDVAPRMLPSAMLGDSLQNRPKNAAHVRLARNLSDLLELDSQELFGQLIVSGDQITNRSLKNLEGLQIISVSIEAINVTNAGLNHLTKVKNLRELRIWAPGVDDAGLPILAKISNLEMLDLEGTSVLGAGLGSAAVLEQLQRLTLGPRMAELELARLEAFPNLRELDLRACRQLTDACVEPLVRLRGLQLIWLPQHLGDASRKAIRQGLPDCQVRL